MGKSLKPLSGLDAAFLYLEASGSPMHVGSLMLLEVPARRQAGFHALLTGHVRERLPRAPVLRRLLHPAPLGIGHPLWSEVATVDLRKHVRRRRLAGTGGKARLDALVGKLHAELLPRELPLWQFVVIENVEPGVLALYAKIHHSLLDGQGGIALAQALLDLAPVAPRKRAAGAKAAPAARTRSRDLARSATAATVRQFANLLRALPATVKAAGSLGPVGGLLARLRDSVLVAPDSVFNRQVGPRRSFTGLSLPLEEAKRAARGFGVSLNDIVLAICAGALRQLLLAAGKLPRAALVAAMPVSLREPGNQQTDNQVSMVQCSLATDIADPIERLRAIHASTAQIKRRVATFKGLIPTDFPGLAAPAWAAGLSRLWGSGRLSERLPALANVAISNVPGPPVPLYLAGAKLRHYYPVSIVTHGLAFNITVQSYSGNLEFGLTACKDVIARPEVVAEAMSAAFAELIDRLP
ncbi:MAG: wax ester/triacylglycerol synthase family O-acyltransferase [Arenimonas sp.]